MITLQVPAPDRGDAASATTEFARRDEVFSAADGAPPLELHFFFLPTSDQQERLIATTKEALSRLTSWFGPLGSPSLTLVDGGWRAASPGAAAAAARDRGGAVVVIRTRWLSPERDISLERAVFTAIARAYWPTPQDDPESPSFAAGLARYSAARAINEAFEGRSLQTYRYFGGFVPHTVRAISLSRSLRDPRPPIFRLPEFEPSLAATTPAWTPVPSAADRAAGALVTLERVVGWPAMQAALLELRHRSSGGQSTARELATVMGEQRGSDVTAFVEAVSSSEDDVDYVVDELTTTRDGGRYQTSVKVRRQGSSAFPVPVTHALCGRERNHRMVAWRGREPRVEFYRAVSSRCRHRGPRCPRCPRRRSSQQHADAGPDVFHGRCPSHGELGDMASGSRPDVRFTGLMDATTR